MMATGSQCVRTPHTLTFVSRGRNFRNIQVILQLAATPSDIINKFDVDACAVYFDGTDVYGNERAVNAFATTVNMIDLSYRSWAYEKRLIKYAKRGFAIGAPGLERERVELRTMRDIKVCRKSLPLNHPLYDHNSYESVSIGEEELKFGSYYSDDEPDEDEYRKATGLRKLLLAEYARDHMGFFRSTERKKFLPTESNRASDLIGAIGTDYGPDVSWFPGANKIFAIKSKPDIFFTQKVKKLPVLMFDSTPISKGIYDITNADWVGTIYDYVDSLELQKDSLKPCSTSTEATTLMHESAKTSP